VAHARALQLLERHGVLTREAVLAEGVPGGFAGLYGVLKALEEAGRIRRGYFVAGLGAAQFALPGAVERLRAQREPAEGDDAAPVVTVLAAADPAQPYGAALPWPESEGRPARAAGAFVVTVDGEPAAYLERGGRSLVTFPATVRPEWVEGLVALVKEGTAAKLEIVRVDGVPARQSDLAPSLRAAGFVDSYRGLMLRD
jgi:ATP-dependent Lhr-like helicase